MAQLQWATVSVHIDGPAVRSWLQHDTRVVGSVVVGIPIDAVAGGTLELVVWLLGVASARPSRQVIVGCGRWVIRLLAIECV